MRGAGATFDTLDLTGWVEQDERKFIDVDGYGDVYEGKWVNIPDELSDTASYLPEIAVKLLKAAFLPSDNDCVYKVSVLCSIFWEANNDL
jgi:hypothetical protein